MRKQIKERYDKGYVTQAQLERFVALGVISEQDAEDILLGTELPEDGMVPAAALDAAYQEGVNSFAG